MIQLCLIIASAIVSFSCSYFQITFMKSKSLGMQTLFDLFLINLLINHQIFVASYTIISILALLFPIFPFFIAKLLAFTYECISVNDGISLFYVPLIRYISIFHSELLANFVDNNIIKNFRLYGLLSSFLIPFISRVFVQDWNTSLTAHNLSGNISVPKENLSDSSVAVFLVFSLAITSFIILQIKLEQKSLEYSEGLLHEIRTKYKRMKIFFKQSSRRNNQVYDISIIHLKDERRPNVKEILPTLPTDYSLLFQRMFVVMIGVMYIMFFYAPRGPSRISQSVFIQIVVVDLLCLTIILENQKLRKFVKHRILEMVNLH